MQSLAQDNDNIQKYDLSSHFDESWLTHDLYVRINGHEIPREDILTFEIFWDGSSAKGVITFNDLEDAFADGKMKAGFIETGWTSQPNTKAGKPAKYEEKFVITKTGQDPSNGGTHKVSQIQFEDYVSHKLKTTYHNEVYDEKSSDMLQKYHKDIGLDIGVVPPKEDSDDEKVAVNTPGHISSSEYVSAETAGRGYSFVLDRFSNYYVHNSNLSVSELPETGEFFDYRGSDYVSRTNIIEYNLEGYDADAVVNSPMRAENRTGTDTAETNENENMMSVDYEAAEDDQSSMRAISGQATSDGTDNNSNSLGNTQKMRIWVPGWNGNRMMMKVKAELPRPITQKQNTNSVAAKGMWLVEAVRDKIINGYFIQELFLTRAEDE